MVNLGIIEDDIHFRDELKSYFDQFSKMINCVFVTKSMENFIKYSKSEHKIDIFLVDINLPGLSGIKGIPKIKKRFPDAEIIMLTTIEDGNSIFKAISAGAGGYLIKNLSPHKVEKELLKIIEDGGAALSPLVARKLVQHFHVDDKKVNSSNSKLKEKEKQIIRLVVYGENYEEIAKILGITKDGVRYHVKNIYKKIQVNSKAEIVRKYFDGFFEWFQ